MGAADQIQRRHLRWGARLIEHDQRVRRAHLQCDASNGRLLDLLEESDHSRTDLRRQKVRGVEQQHRAEIGPCAVQILEIEAGTPSQFIGGCNHLALFGLRGCAAESSDHRIQKFARTFVVRRVVGLARLVQHGILRRKSLPSGLDRNGHRAQDRCRQHPSLQRQFRFFHKRHPTTTSTQRQR